MSVLVRQRRADFGPLKTSTKNVNDFRADVNDPMNTGGPMSTMTSRARQGGPLTSYVTPVGGHVNDGPTSTKSMRHTARASGRRCSTANESRAA
jgi:hypothetical protein